MLIIDNNQFIQKLKEYRTLPKASIDDGKNEQYYSQRLKKTDGELVKEMLESAFLIRVDGQYFINREGMEFLKIPRKK